MAEYFQSILSEPNADTGLTSAKQNRWRGRERDRYEHKDKGEEKDTKETVETANKQTTHKRNRKKTAEKITNTSIVFAGLNTASLSCKRATFVKMGEKSPVLF